MLITPDGRLNAVWRDRFPRARANGRPTFRILAGTDAVARDQECHVTCSPFPALVVFRHVRSTLVPPRRSVVVTLFRTVLFWSHLAAGLTAGIVVVIMSVTGLLLTYQRQMQYWADTRHYGVEAPVGVERLPAAQLVAAAQAVDPATPATTITLRAERSEPAAVALGSRTIYLNPYTATPRRCSVSRRERGCVRSSARWSSGTAIWP